MGKVFAYARVSTTRQGERGVSLPEQRDAISRYAERHGLEIVQWFEEQESASKQGRPEFNRMLRLLRLAPKQRPHTEPRVMECIAKHETPLSHL